MLRLVEDEASGIDNVVGPGAPMTSETFLREASAALGVTPALGPET